MQNQKNQLQITEKEVKFIYADDYEFFQNKILSNCYCLTCKPKKYNSKIVNYQIFINHLNDVILRGFCSECGSRLNRYLETGEVVNYVQRIKKVKQKYV